jgi:tyrosine-protein phosphatase YwqE
VGYGPQITKIAEQLLAKGMYSYVGSDVHHNNHIAALNKSKTERFGTIKRSDSQQSVF